MADDTRSLSSLPLDELRAIYEREVGRPTTAQSTHYLVNKISAARRGDIRVGKLPSRRNPDLDRVTLPLRVTVAQRDALDDVVDALGLDNRAELMRAALSAYLLPSHPKVALLFAD